MGQLHNRVALITGAGRGIGRAIALAYAKEGAKLALAARTRRDLEQTAQEAQALGAPTCIVPVDVSDPAQVEDMVRHTIEQFATIDILVNNAGMAGPVGPPAGKRHDGVDTDHPGEPHRHVSVLPRCFADYAQAEPRQNHQPVWGRGDQCVA